MSPEQHLTFGSYRLDLHSAQLWRGRRLVRLTGKAFGVLRYLVSRPGQLVTKDDLLAAVWPEVVVTETALTKRIQEVRRALGDDPKAPRYIETVHRQGFRFIAPLTTGVSPSLESRVQRLVSERQGPASTVQTLDARRQTLPWWAETPNSGSSIAG